MEGKLGSQEEESDVLRADLNETREKAIKYSNALAAREEELKNLNEKLTAQKKDIEELQEKFQIQFKNLANEILDEKTKKFTDQNKTNLSDILNPLKEKIVEFEKKVEQSNKESIERNSALKEQITGLKELNQQITKEAENLKQKYGCTMMSLVHENDEIEIGFDDGRRGKRIPRNYLIEIIQPRAERPIWPSACHLENRKLHQNVCNRAGIS